MPIPQTRSISLKLLTPNDQNPRSIKDHKFQKLVNNMRKNPWMLEYRPIVADDNGVILGGNMRFRAAEFLGWETIAVINAKDLTEEQRKEFIILDNQDFGEWDYDVLAAHYEPTHLVELGFEPNQLGFSFLNDDGEEVERGGGEFEGLPAYEPKENPFQLMVQFDTEEQRDEFIKTNSIVITAKNGLTFSCWHPAKERSDNSSVKFE